MFGEDYGLHISSIRGMGTDVEIHLPFCTVYGEKGRKKQGEKYEKRNFKAAECQHSLRLRVRTERYMPVFVSPESRWALSGRNIPEKAVCWM